MVKNAMEMLLQAIELEQNIGNLYMRYYEIFKDESDFWWKIANEEYNHAALLESAKFYIKIGKFPDKLLKTTIEELKLINNEIRNKINYYKLNNSGKEEAYNFALKLEKSAYEMHFQNIVSEKIEDDLVLKIIKKLNGDDKDHYIRIKNLMEYLKIEIKEGIVF